MVNVVADEHKRLEARCLLLGLGLRAAIVEHAPVARYDLFMAQPLGHG